MINAGHLALLG